MVGRRCGLEILGLGYRTLRRALLWCRSVHVDPAGSGCRAWGTASSLEVRSPREHLIPPTQARTPSAESASSAR